MDKRIKGVPAAVLFAALMASQGAFAQGGNNSSGNTSTGQGTGTAATKGSHEGSTGTAGDNSGGTLMQKREQGMAPDHSASSPSSTGKMSQ